MRDKKKWDGYVPPEKRRPPDEYFDLTELKSSVRIDVISKESKTVAITIDQVPIVNPNMILKYVLHEGSGTIV